MVIHNYVFDNEVLYFQQGVHNLIQGPPIRFWLNDFRSCLQYTTEGLNKTFGYTNLITIGAYFSIYGALL